MSDFGDYVFNHEIMVRSEERLPQYDRGSVMAYAAISQARSSIPVFALVCDEGLTPRISKAQVYTSVLNPCVCRLMAHGAMLWPADKKRKYVFIFENKLGATIVGDDTGGGYEWKPDRVLDVVVKPVLSVLGDFRDRDFIHGQIHPANMFDGGNKNFDRVILGECLSLPMSYALPPLYHTIERAMTQPDALGAATMADDLYALGVTMAVLLRSTDPMVGYTREQIAAEKMEIGSFSALIGKDRVTGSVLELMRGLLADDVSQRWSLDDIKAWFDGRRNAPKQAIRRLRAARPIMFNGQKYMRPEPLARDLQFNPAEAVQLIESGEMEQWITRALDDEALGNKVSKATAMASEGGKGSGYPERMVTRLSIAMDSSAPIRFKGVAVMPEGIGKALTHAYVTKADMRIFQEMLEATYVLQWVDMHEQGVVDTSALLSKFEACRTALRQKTSGFGLERCIYLLNSETHCLSDKIAFYQARTPDEIIQALEVLSASPSRPQMLLDRHITAFLGVKDKTSITPFLPEISASEPYKRVMGEFRALAGMQKKSRFSSLPGIFKWIAGNLDSVYERIHDRDMRERLKSQVKSLADSGNLVRMLERIDDEDMRQNDRNLFRRNMKYFYDLSVEYKKLEAQLTQGNIYGRDLGRQISAITSFVIATIVVLVSAYLTFFGHGR